MESQLQNGYTDQGMTHAVTICKFPKEHRPRIRVLALRYIFMYKKFCKIPRLIPTSSQLVQISISMFEDFLLDRNTEYMNEIADILDSHGPGNYGRMLLDRIREIETTPPVSKDKKQVKVNIPVEKTIYADSQNVHNSKINQTVVQVLENLYSIYKKQINLQDSTSIENKNFKLLCIDNISNILLEKYPEKKELIRSGLKYIKNSIATFGKDNITIQDAFLSLWAWISTHKDKTELESRLLEELKEMSGMCTTGHIARLMNVIQGFTEDDRLCIRISDLDQCNSVIRKYLNDMLSKCTDEKVLEGMIDGSDEYVRFIRRKIADKLLLWQNEYGKEILNHVAKVTNEFAKTEVFAL